MIRLFAFDLDGTLTQHKSPLEEKNIRLLNSLGKKYKLLMVGAGSARRIFDQMGHYPIDIIGNYGMEYAEFDHETKELIAVRNDRVPCDKAYALERMNALRDRFGLHDVTGEPIQYHDSGCLTFPILGTKADLADKLAFDPDKSKRRPIYPSVCEAFPDFEVVIGGTSSFDMSPRPFNKYYALDRYCAENGYAHDEVAFVGDDYREGGNDHSVFDSDFNFVKTDDYRTTAETIFAFLKERGEEFDGTL